MTPESEVERMLADQVEAVIGVDTHRDRHVLAVVSAATGALVAEASVAADGRGYERALALARRHAPGRRAWAVEGSGSYGAGLVRLLVAHGERVIEIGRPERRGERTKAKSDRLDALRAARTALGRTRLACPRAGGAREGVRVLMVARAGAVSTRARALQQLRALIVSAPDRLRARLRGLGEAALLARCAGLRAPAGADAPTIATVTALRSLARRALAADREASALERDIGALVRALGPQLLAELGIGPISAAQLLMSHSHRGRFERESAFARMAAAAPIPASSGQVVRHRLDRGGDRQLNRALHTILLTRMRHDPATRAYIARRMSEGKSTREAMRCLKRYLARHLYRLLEAEAQASGPLPSSFNAGVASKAP
jgi:transposase